MNSEIWERGVPVLLLLVLLLVLLLLLAACRDASPSPWLAKLRRKLRGLNTDGRRR